jgi:uncharacterized repeat protein (TIGR03806 family)
MRRAIAAVLAAGAVFLSGAGPAPQPVNVAALLDETPAPTLAAYGLFADPGGRTAKAELVPYALNTPLFSDYSDKHRFVFVPKGERVRYRETGAFEFPVGTALVKTFAYPADLRRPTENVRYLETRLLIRRASGWAAVTYVWNPEQTEARLKRAGARLDVAFNDAKGERVAFSYAVPNVNQCKECHSVSEALSPIGPRARNLNGDFAYADGAENQLARWTRIGLLEGAPAPARAPVMARWDDPAASLQARAHAYLDANCAHCHSPQGIANNSGLFLEWEQTDPVARGLEKRPVAAGRGSGGLDYAIAPGDPDRSILIHRMASREPGVMMPELGRSLIHDEGLQLLRTYVAAMPKTGAERR